MYTFYEILKNRALLTIKPNRVLYNAYLIMRYLLIYIGYGKADTHVG